MEKQTQQGEKKKGRRLVLRILSGALVLLLAALLALYLYRRAGAQEHTLSTFAMDTLVHQTAYGTRATEAMRQVNTALAQLENQLSLYNEGGEISRINAAAGMGGVEVSPETADFLRRGLALSAESEGAFALTIAPVSLAWGVTSGSPRVPEPEEIDALLSLVDDGAVTVEGNLVTLPRAGMALDLGGIAKGEACRAAAQIYAENNVDSALISFGGSSIYARGTKPDGSEFRVGFLDPHAGGGAYLGSFGLRDAVAATSGGYERYFEAEGERYIHIFDPATGRPAVSDILSVAVIHEDGAAADLLSTTLFVWGRDRALQFMREGGKAILLDEDGNLYVSESLRDTFRIHEGVGDGYNLTFVAGG